MIKICTGCGEERDTESDFNWKYKIRGTRHTRCKFCQSKLSKQHYQENKQSYMVRTRARELIVLADNRSRIAAYLTRHPCVDCGQINIQTLEFDHVRGTKVESIARMMGEGYSWSTIEAEIAKCEVRCANCHRIKTSSTNDRNTSWRYLLSTSAERLLPDSNRTPGAMKTAQRRIESQKQLHLYLSEHPCIDCGCPDFRVLELDHIRGTKYKSIAELLTRGATWKFIEAEIAKCEVRCSNCHRIKTNERAGWWRNRVE